MFCKAKSAKKTFFLRGNLRPFPNKNVQMWDHFFPLLFAKDSESLKILDIRLREVGAKRPLNGTSKVNRQTDRQTDTQRDKHMDILTYRKHRPRGPMLWKCKGPAWRVLWDKLRLLKPMEFLGSFGFCKRCMISWYLPQGAKHFFLFFVNVLWWTISSWNFFHKCDTPNLIYVIIHVEKTFRALHCQKCGKYFKKKQRITEHLKKST